MPPKAQKQENVLEPYMQTDMRYRLLECLCTCMETADIQAKLKCGLEKENALANSTVMLDM